ncbi:hypothetical protein SCLCIDRAFT_135060 [Scleroderma citrinum Foug A]|uniref:Uncharacterized protein n=1 Tax=Scleroderma citrinum Foug A TaxID=1036808 RepID=A0A0C3DFU6_9AGAM|nr:hypothetical protein SCLCIDRAFT_135060 [Scleroderma citrinum Foug A]
MEPTNKATINQPQAAMEMSVTSPVAANNAQNDHEHHHAKRIRGGGAAKDIFLGAIECFICFGCPCEMCC